jgi:hypothetical protein
MQDQTSQTAAIRERGGSIRSPWTRYGPSPSILFTTFGLREDRRLDTSRRYGRRGVAFDLLMSEHAGWRERLVRGGPRRACRFLI